MDTDTMRTTYVAAPRHCFEGRLVWGYDEDELTAAWDVLRAASLPAGTPVASDIDLPAWFTQAAGIHLTDATDGWRLQQLDGPAGDIVLLHMDEDPGGLASVVADVHTQAQEIDAEAAARIRQARDDAPREADFPLGAYVPLARHEAVLRERLRLGTGHVVTWTTIGAGAAPSEFQRRQEAMGAYHVVMVAAGDTRTVGLWAGTTPPATGEPCRPVLRRLLRQQGAWRYGVAFRPGP